VVPIVPQDYPPASQVQSVATIDRLIRDFESIAVFKHEDAPACASCRACAPTRSACAGGSAC
jgi:hypothetical protein